jgi:hypothetical protein
MKSKPVQWLLAAALLVIAVPGWAQPELVGGEFKVSQSSRSRQVKPQVAFNPSGSYLIVWENSIQGILGRTYDRNGKPTTGEMVLVANKNLPGIPGRGNVMVRKDPMPVYLPGGELLLFWTEEKDFLSLDYFYEQREMLEQDVYGQRFTAQGVPAGERFRVNATAANFQRRPRALSTPTGILVVWEQASTPTESDSTAIYGRLLTRRGAPAGSELRVDAGGYREIWHLALAVNASGQFLVAWEADKANDPDVLARVYDRGGVPVGEAFVANPSTLGRQRRPAALATKDGDFLVVWQSSVTGAPFRTVGGQLYSPAGGRLGNEIELSRGTSGHVHACPALALLPSGNIVVAWIDWAGTFPDGVFGRILDSDGAPLESPVAISQDRIFPQYLISLAANAHGDVVATWESRITKERAIAARRLKAD